VPVEPEKSVEPTSKPEMPAEPTTPPETSTEPEKTPKHEKQAEPGETPNSPTPMLKDMHTHKKKPTRERATSRATIIPVIVLDEHQKPRVESQLSQSENIALEPDETTTKQEEQQPVSKPTEVAEEKKTLDKPISSKPPTPALTPAAAQPAAVETPKEPKEEHKKSKKHHHKSKSSKKKQEEAATAATPVAVQKPFVVPQRQLSVEEMRELVNLRGPRDVALVQCHVERSGKRRHALFRVYFENGGVMGLAAKKHTGTESISYNISVTNNTSSTGEGIVAKLRSNFRGTDFVLTECRPKAEGVPPSTRELAAVFYAPPQSEDDPRAFTVLLPPYKGRYADQPPEMLVRTFKEFGSTDAVAVLHNKEPVWREGA